MWIVSPIELKMDGESMGFYGMLRTAHLAAAGLIAPERRAPCRVEITYTLTRAGEQAIEPENMHFFDPTSDF